MVPVQDAIGDTILGEDEFIKPHTTLEGLASLKASFEEMGRMGYDAVALQRYPQVERIRHVHTAGNRITSYNVCYTKLLRGALDAQRNLAAVGNEQGGEARHRCVA